MAGGTFNLAQKKIRPGTYVNTINGRRQNDEPAAAGVATIPLLGYDWGPRGEWIILEAGSPDAFRAKLGRSVHDETNTFMIMLATMLMGAAVVYAYIPDIGAKASATKTFTGDVTVTFTAKYKGTLGNKISVVSVANPVSGFDVSVYLDGELVEIMEGLTNVADIDSEYIDASATGTVALEAFASATLANGTDGTVSNTEVTAYLDAAEGIRFNCMAFPSTDSSQQAALLTKIRYIRETIGWKCQAVAPDFVANYEGIINLTNAFKYGDVSLSKAQACAWLAGMTAGADFATSLTYRQVAGATGVVGILTNEQAISAIKAGKAFFITDENGNVVLETDINSRTTFDSTTPANINKNRPLRVYDQFANDCLVTFRPNQFDNNEAGYQAIEGVGRGMLVAYESSGAIQNVDAENDFVVDRSQSADDYVVINVGLQALDSIEKYYIQVIAR